MFGNTSPLLLLIAFFVALMVPLALVVLQRYVNPPAVLVAAFFLLAPLSAADEIPAYDLIKYARIYCSVLIIMLGVFVMRAYRLGPTGIVFAAFASFYTFAGLYSGSPLAAVTVKGLYLTIVFAGLIQAMSFRDFGEIKQMMRLVALSSSVFAFIVLVAILQNPYNFLRMGRFMVLGLNPNRLGMEMAPMAIVAAALVLYDKAKFWKAFGFALGAFCSLVLIATGSRGGVGMAAIGGFALLVPLVKRPVVLGVTLAAVGATLYLVVGYVSPESFERLQDTSFATRGEPWEMAMNAWRESPLIGKGWSPTDATRLGWSTQNFHSIYFQVLAETGLVGIGFFAVALLYCGVRGLRMYAQVRHNPVAAGYAVLALGFVVGTLAHGLAEAGTILGSNINALILPMALGLFDRIPELLRQQEVAQDGAAQEAHDAADSTDDADADHDAYSHADAYAQSYDQGS